MVVYNIASQDRPGAIARLGWLRTGVQEAVRDAAQRGRRAIALPQIGCGIGGLAWGDVLSLLQEIAESGPVDIEAWTHA